MRRLLGLVLAAVAATLLISGSAQATFPGKNGKIVYRYGDVWGPLRQINPDGTGDRSLIDPFYGGRVDGQLPLRWSPDGGHMLFTNEFVTDPPCAFHHQYDLWTRTAEGLDLRNVTYTRNQSEVAGDWSPDGRSIVFARVDSGCDPPYSPGGISLWTMDAAGGNEHPLGLHGIDPLWSPDGSEFAYRGSIDRGGAYVARVDGSGERLISPPWPAFLGEPIPDHTFVPLDWSPDGKKLLVEDRKAPSSGVWIVDRNGAVIAHLAQELWGRWPTWSPDGTRIAFVGGEFDPEGNTYVDIFRVGYLFTIKVDGTDLRQMTADRVALYPRWQPIPGPKRSDYKNANQFCRAEQAFWAGEFSQRYASFGACVSGR